MFENCSPINFVRLYIYITVKVCLHLFVRKLYYFIVHILCIPHGMFSLCAPSSVGEDNVSLFF